MIAVRGLLVLSGSIQMAPSKVELAKLAFVTLLLSSALVYGVALSLKRDASDAAGWVVLGCGLARMA